MLIMATINAYSLSRRQVNDIAFDCLRVPSCSECPDETICNFRLQTEFECASVTCFKPIIKICDKMAIQCRNDSCPNGYECIVKNFDPVTLTCAYTDCVVLEPKPTSTPIPIPSHSIPTSNFKALL